MDDKKKKDDIGFGQGIGGIFKGLSGFVDACAKFAEQGEAFKKSGEIDFGGLGKIKGLKDLKGVYGVNIRTMSDGSHSLQPFGNIKTSPKGPVVEEMREPLIDLFEEGDQIQIIAEMPGVDENEISLEVRDDIVVIKAGGKKRQYEKEVLLSRSVKEEDLKWTYNNGVLEIIIQGLEKDQ